MNAQDIINALELTPLPEEGGYYRETYRASRKIQSQQLGEKSECTAIYYLITQDSFSALHTVDQDEIFHFYAGSPVEMLQITPEGDASLSTLGNNLLNKEAPQIIVPHGIWQGTRLKTPSKDAWALLGCTVAPGFDFENFHIKPRAELIKLFPQLTEQITRFTN